MSVVPVWIRCWMVSRSPGSSPKLKSIVSSRSRRIGIDHALMRRGFGQVDLDCLDPASPGARAEGGLHAVIVEIGIEQLIAGTQPVVAADQAMQRFGGTSGEGDLVGRGAQVGGDA